MQRLALRRRIDLLIFSTVFLLMALNGANIYISFQNDVSAASAQLRVMARSLSNSIKAELDTRIATLEVLALSRALAENDLQAFRRQAEAVLLKQLPGSNIVLVDRAGQQVLNTVVPAGVALPRRQYLENQEKVFASGRPSVSDLYPGPGLERPVIAIEVPVPGPDGQPRLVLALNPTLDTFSAILREYPPQADWAATVLDRSGLRIGRVPGGQELIGTRPPEQFLVERDSRADGVTRVTSAEGVPLLVAYRRLDDTGWTVAVGSPVANLTGPAWRHALVSLAIGGLLLLLCLAVAQRLASSILRPFAALRDLAASKDEARRYAPTGLREADEVAEAFLQEASRRQAATVSLLNSERRLRLSIAELNHRVKNVLATVQALAFQTARGEADLERFQSVFSARLSSLARAHDLITAFSWQAASLDAVLRTGLTPWLEPARSPPQLVIDPSCGHEAAMVLPSQAQALVLALHELATNAIKHGALTQPDGLVTVACAACEGGDHALIHWIETGGPAVPGPPARQGFGMRLLKRALRTDLGAGSEVELDFLPQGLQARIKVKVHPTSPAALQLAGLTVD